jgi:sulfide:quinone oxidoreductase
MNDGEIIVAENVKERPCIVVLGAGLGGTVAAFEIKAAIREHADVHVISDSEYFSFVPSNPWVALRWRKPDAVQVHLPPIFRRKKINFTSVGAKRVHPNENRVELGDGQSIAYDYLVIATGPDLAFDEVKGLGPHVGHSVSICQLAHARAAADAFDAFVKTPGPIIVGAAQGASCFGPAYEFAMMLDTELRRRKIRDRVPMTFVTPEPYIGHLGLDGVGDTKSMLESEMRNRHIKWVTNARTTSLDPGMMHIEEVGSDGAVTATHDLPFKYAMMLPAFRGIPAVFGIEGLTNPRGFIIVDEHQRSKAFPNIFALGVCIAIPPAGSTPVPVGVPKTGFMIESMVAAVALNLVALIEGRAPTSRATWNALCLADFGDDGIAFVAQPQIPPRNVNWSGRGKWVHLAKVAFEKYFLRKIRKGENEPFYEGLVMKAIGLEKLKTD